jgi:ER-bound oxygenase mpaB/B'/Rubber oxygenase, catalytic domain
MVTQESRNVEKHSVSGSVRSAADDRHPYDYYFRPGMPCRPAPPRAVVNSMWDTGRHDIAILGRRFRQAPAETDVTRLFADHLWQGDEPMDAVVRCFARIGAQRGREMLDRALDDGIDAVGDAPEELTALFDQLDNPAIPYDPVRWEHGRQVWISSSYAAKLGMLVGDFYGTFVGDEVAAATGATGRFVSDPYRRFLESNTWFRNVTYRDAMDRFSPVFKDTVRVRLMHAQVRAGLRRSWGDDHFARHGNPISNATMMGAAVTFGLLPLAIDHTHGRRRSAEDFDAALYYWAYIAYIFGVAEELIPRTAVDALETADFMTATAGGPSEWTAVMADSATTAFADPTMAGAIKRALTAPLLGLMAYYVGEPLVRALLKTTPLHAVRLGIWPQVLGAVVSLNVHYCAALDRLPALDWRRRRKAANGDPFWRQYAAIATAMAARRGITGTPYDHHEATPGTAPGCPVR